jgi:plastocyanin
MRGARSRILAVLLVGLICESLAPTAWAEPPSAIRGRVMLDISELSLSSLGPIVVYLEPGPGQTSTVPADSPVQIIQKGAQFHPSFLVIEVGRTLEMPNADAIYHNVFSYSRPNNFDLGIYPTGESRSVTFRSPGVVKTYCSIHETMNATILVAPSRYHTIAGTDGRFALDGLPAGSWILRSWSERFPDTEQTIELKDGETAVFEIRLTTTQL